MDPLNFLLHLADLTNRLTIYYPNLKVGIIDPLNKEPIGKLREEDIGFYLTGDLEIQNPLSIEEARDLLLQLEGEIYDH